MNKAKPELLDELTLKPVAVWRKRVKRNGWAAFLALAFFLLTAGFFIYFLGSHMTQFIDYVNKSGASYNPLIIGVVSLNTILLLWMLHQLSRVIVTSLATAQYSAHRAAVLETYLALAANDEELAEEARPICAQTVFRPEAPNVAASTFPPNIFEFTEQLVKNRKK